jgi:hypothetical protein
MIDSLTNTTEPRAVDLTNTRRTKPMVDSSKIDRLPPHSAEAEQGVLGCILLSPHECMGEAIEKFKGVAEVFYDLRHRTIYELLVLKPST